MSKGFQTKTVSKVRICEFLDLNMFIKLGKNKQINILFECDINFTGSCCSF